MLRKGGGGTSRKGPRLKREKKKSKSRGENAAREKFGKTLLFYIIEEEDYTSIIMLSSTRYCKCVSENYVVLFVTLYYRVVSVLYNCASTRH